jgi:molybdate transport system substrate-binding protein
MPGLLKILLSMVFVIFLSSAAFAGTNLMVFAGAASKPATEEAASEFEKVTGVKVELVFGGSGYVLSQMLLSQKGDIYFPGSSDYMEIAKKKGAVLPETEKKVVYLVPAINAQNGNPKNIQTLRDLTRPGVRVAIANPEGVCIGVYAVEIIEEHFNPEEKAAFKRNLVNYTESCEKTATVISLKAVDAVIGWSVFHHWDPERIETIPIAASEIIRLGYIPIAISKYSKDPDTAQRFIDFVLSEKGKEIFRSYHYFMTPEEAMIWVGEEKPVGGEYTVPPEWMAK